MDKLHPGARWLFRVRGYFGAIILAAFVFPFLGVFGSFVSIFLLQNIFASILIFIFLGLIFVVVIAEIYARMAYNRWFYEVGHHNIRLERGIIWKKYSNVPYERIQNVDITRGIIARMCGFSTLHIQTAGYSMPVRGHGSGAEGTIPALDPEHAEQIREYVLKRIRGKHQGL